MIAGGAGVGALVAGKKGAAIGAGGQGFTRSIDTLLVDISKVAREQLVRW
jgi:hypothetical protein